MNTDDVLLLVLDRLRAVLDVPVEFKGEGDTVEVPGVVVGDWNPIRLHDKHGAQTYASPVLDINGNETAEEHHVYYELSLDVVVNTHDRGKRADVMEAVAAAFLPYEDRPQALAADLHSVWVGEARPRHLALREPDWFVAGRELRLQYLQRFTVDENEPIATLEKIIDPNVTIERESTSDSSVNDI